MSSEEQEVIDELDDTWMLNLQEFIDTLEPNIRQSTSSQEIVDMLSTLEATDVNFHRYSFIQQIKTKLNAGLRPIIDEAIKNADHDIKNGDTTAVSTVCKNILDSKEFVMLSNEVCEKVKKASHEITQHINSESFDFSELPLQDTKNNHYIHDDSICSTSDGIDYMFMSPDRYKSLTKEIHVSKSIPTRSNALGILQQVPQTDLVASDVWKSTRQGLLVALDDDNEEINIRALRFISRLFSSGSSHVVREYFLMLVENLIDYFNDDTSHMISLDAGLDLGDRRNVLLLRKFRLLSQIQHELPKYWLRYSEKYVEEMAEASVMLLAMIPTPISLSVGRKLMTPLHFLSLIDPLGEWFKIWTHGVYGRAQVLKHIPESADFLKEQIECCLNFTANIRKKQRASKNNITDDYVFFHTEDIRYIYFLHSLNVVSRLMLYKEGRNLLSSSMNNDKIVETLLITFIDILKVLPVDSLNVQKTPYHPIYLIKSIFESFSMNTDSMECITEKINLELLAAIEHCFLNEETISSKNILLVVLSDILSHLISSSILQDENVLDSIVKSISSIFEKYLTSEKLPATSLLALLSLLKEIYSKPTGVIMLQPYKVLTFLRSYLEKERQKQMKTVTNQDDGLAIENPTKDTLEVENQLLQHLIVLAMTPKGIRTLFDMNELENCVLNGFKGYFVTQYHYNKIDEIDMDVMMYQLAATSCGIVFIEKTDYISDLLHETWHQLEGYENDTRKTILTNVFDDFSDRSAIRIYDILIKFLSGFPTIRHTCSAPVGLAPSQLGVAESETDQNDDHFQPHNFIKFFNHTVLLDSSEKIEKLYHYDKTHLFGLHLFNTIVDCLDSMLYLQNVFNFQQVLLDLQAHCESPGRKEYMLDECALKRNEILVKVYALGGPNERIIPPDCLTQDSSKPYPWPLFASYPIPDVYIVRATTKSSSDYDEVDASVTTLLNELKLSDENGQTRKEEEATTTSQLESDEKLKQVFFGSVLGKNFEGVHRMLIEMMEKSLKWLLQSKSDLIFPEQQENSGEKQQQSNSSLKKIELDDISKHGVELVIRYGQQLRLLQSQSESTESFSILLLKIRDFFHASTTKNQFNGFDWFVGVIFLLFSHEKRDPWPFIQDFSKTLHSAYLWMNRIDTKHSSNNGPPNEKFHPVFTNSCHFIDLILQQELPQVYAAFKLSNYPASQISQLWLRQCFLNYLDFQQILWYISSCIVLGIDYQIYFTIAVYKDLQADILYHTQNEDLISFLRNTPVDGFSIQTYSGFMKELERKYRPLIEKHLKDFLDTCDL